MMELTCSFISGQYTIRKLGSASEDAANIAAQHTRAAARLCREHSMQIYSLLTTPAVFSSNSLHFDYYCFLYCQRAQPIIISLLYKGTNSLHEHSVAGSSILVLAFVVQNGCVGRFFHFQIAMYL